ncbi:hypothetical protein [Actinoplanes sp. N902-109]|uniref:hypothetical protein n=1 Tax=Actinoplanes sp. (strain N902-109) TaxID=649831 RepID=UPI00039E3122|nr:hypothetical protein [Actinoplanes sp. N902-109]
MTDPPGAPHQDPLSEQDLAEGEQYATDHDPGPGEDYAGDPVPDPWEEEPYGELDPGAVPGVSA